MERYVRRVAAPAVERFVVYNFDSRMEADEGSLAPIWYNRAYDKALELEYREDEDWLCWADGIEDLPAGLTRAWRIDAAKANFSAMCADDDKWVEHHNAGSECPGFAGYDADDVETLSALVLATLAKHPAQRTLDFAAFLRSAHGVECVDDIEPAFDCPSYFDARGPSSTLGLVEVSPWGPLNDNQIYGVVTATLAYLPSADSARPVPVTAHVYTFNHRRFDDREETGNEYCAMGPHGSALPMRLTYESDFGSDSSN